MSSSNDEGGPGWVPPPIRVGVRLRDVWCGGFLQQRIEILEVQGQWCRVGYATGERWMHWDCVASFEVDPTS